MMRIRNLMMAFGLSLLAAAPVSAVENEPELAGALKVPTVHGATFDLSAQRGQWVVINYWATWCSPCLKEMPDLDAFDKAHENAMVVGLAYEDITVPEMQAFLKEHPVSYPIAIVDVYDPPAAFPAPRGLPMTWLVDPEGRIAKRFLGPITARDLEKAIAPATP
jgi:thiol-disulfide isomerase/thioredoxin